VHPRTSRHLRVPDARRLHLPYVLRTGSFTFKDIEGVLVREITWRDVRVYEKACGSSELFTAIRSAFGGLVSTRAGPRHMTR